MAYFPLPGRTRVQALPPQSGIGKFRIARVFGIDITLDPSWFIIIVLVVMSIHAQFALLFEESVRAPVLWATAFLEGLLFFGSVLIHELSHSLVARRLGVGVDSITLFIFGGVSSLKEEPSRAKDEFLISGAGPLASLVLAGGSALISALLPAGSFPRYFFHWLAVTNVALAIFNMLPGFPLDGGRVLRAVVWRATGSLTKATRVASLAGRGIAYLLMALGVFFLLSRGGLVNGLWFILIGWFLLNAAQSGMTDLQTRRSLQHHEVRQVMRRDCPRIPGAMSVDLFVEEYLLRTGERCFFVSDDDTLAGLVTLGDIRDIPRDRWREIRIRDVMVPFERVHHVADSDSLLTALEAMNRDRLHQLPVLDREGRFVGVVTREGVLRAVAVDLELERSEAPPPA